MKFGVLFLAHSFTMGGIQTATINLINSLNKNKFNVFVIYGKDGDLLKKLNKDNIFIKKDKIPKYNRRILPKIIYSFKISNFIKKNNIQLVFTMAVSVYPIGAIASFLSKTKHIRVQPNFILQTEPTNVALMRYTPFVKWTDLFITFGQKQKVELEQAGVNHQKIKVFFSGPDTYDYTKAGTNIREELSIPDDFKIVITAHRLTKGKGLDIFVDMIPYILEVYPKVIFLIMGIGELREELEQKALNHGITGNLIFTGFRDDVKEIAYQSTFGVYPDASSAGMSWVIEAGIPLITQKNSSMDQYLIDGKTGILVEECSPKAYADACLSLLRDEEKLKEMYEFIKENPLHKVLGWDESMDINNIFLSVLNQGK
ncbi:MAG: glycosyltransferase family 4 protein [Bacilli bacterium]|nr:glycosyltransferase family 4 protein [Bacilli bacterium]